MSRQLRGDLHPRRDGHAATGQRDRGQRIRHLRHRPHRDPELPPATAGPATTETLTWNDGADDTSTIDRSIPAVTGHTVVCTGTVTAGHHQGDTATTVTSGISYVGSVAPCLLGTPIAAATGIGDRLPLTH